MTVSAPPSPSRANRGWVLWRRIALTGSAQLYSLLSGVVVVLLTARWLGPEGRGQYAAVIAWATLFSSMLHLSLGQVAIHQATRLRRTDWLPATLGALLGVAVVATVLGWSIAAVLFFRSHLFGALDGSALALGFVSMPFYIWEQYGSALLIATGSLRSYNSAQVAGRTVVLVAVVFAWAAGLGVMWLIGAAVLGQSVVAIGGMRTIARAANAVEVRWEAIRELIGGGLKLHWNYLGASVLTTSGVLMVNRYHGVGATGEYQLALQGISILAVIPQASSFVFLENVAADGPTLAWLHQRRPVAFLGLSSVIIGVIASLLAPYVLPYLLGPKFTGAIAPFRIVTIALPGMALAGVMASQWIGRGFFVHISAVTCGLAVINVVANRALIPPFGAVGAAWATAIVYLFAGLVQLGMIVHCERGLRTPGSYGA